MGSVRTKSVLFVFLFQVCWLLAPQSNAISISRILQRVSWTLPSGGKGSNSSIEYGPHRQISWWKLRTSLLSAATEGGHTTNEEENMENSVHLKLGSEAMKGNQEPTKKRNKSTVLSYKDPKTGLALTGLNISQKRFKAWLEYTLKHSVSSDLILKEEKEVLPKDREGLREKWKSRELLCDRTELLTVYPSDKKANGEGKRKRGGFGDLLHLYAERFYGILVDEQEEKSEQLKDWLYAEYGVKETRRLTASSFRKQQQDEQFRILQHFLDWFRSEFPYYYDRCGACGASYKDEQKDPHHDNEPEHEGSFLGYIFPSDKELTGKAGRTELYHCHKCQSFTRFPRFNKASAVLDMRQGRCGEYSMLLYRMLRSIGHETRWIVDWADHVWAEILLPSTQEWIHLDPCEAAVNKPLLYQEWGKQQTHIVGFYAGSKLYPIIEDLTTKYTSDDIKKISSRREESATDFDETITNTSQQLRDKISFLGKDILYR